MPEGHAIHRLALDHQALLGGQKIIVLSPQGRFAAESRMLNGQMFQRAEAHGKHLFYFWSSNLVTHIHLGLYGRFRVHRNPADGPRGAVRLRLIGKRNTLDLNGPNCCELISLTALNKIRQRLGPDPLHSDANPEPAWLRICNSRRAIGALLLDQSVIAGIGNVYRAEILFLLGICPERPGNSIDHELFDEIWQLAGELLATGVKYNRIVTVAWESLAKPPNEATLLERTLIYKSPECPRCGDDVYYWSLGNRTIYACDSCQS